MPGGLERQNAFSEYYGSKTFVEVRAFILGMLRSILIPTLNSVAVSYLQRV